jgi:hypothetical protein
MLVRNTWAREMFKQSGGRRGGIYYWSSRGIRDCKRAPCMCALSSINGALEYLWIQATSYYNRKSAQQLVPAVSEPIAAFTHLCPAPDSCPIYYGYLVAALHASIRSNKTGMATGGNAKGSVKLTVRSSQHSQVPYNTNH